MKKTYLLAVGMAPLSHALLAQVPVSKDANSMRSGDLLCKVEVDYVNPGQRGNDAVWPLGRVTKQSKEIYQAIASSRDTVAVFEKDRILHYLIHGDTLVEKGEQSKRAYMLYSQERPVLRYPFQYGDSLAGIFVGRGRDENIMTQRTGWGYSVADGMGVLTDGEDTIPHITRVRFFDDFTDSYCISDTVKIRQQYERCSWYCAGYRYPVMESMRWTVVEDDSKFEPVDSVTYLYLPIMQMDLNQDLVNDSIQNQIAIAEILKKQSSSGKNNTLSSVNACFTGDGKQLNISYILDESSDIDICACDILGFILGRIHHDAQEAGERNEDLQLSRKPIGNTLMLNIKCGESVMSMKINR